MLPFTDRIQADAHFFFSAPSHSAKTTAKWFSAHTVAVLDLPDLKKNKSVKFQNQSNLYLTWTQRHLIVFPADEGIQAKGTKTKY